MKSTKKKLKATYTTRAALGPPLKGGRAEALIES